jgi:hypothetical protein
MRKSPAEAKAAADPFAGVRLDDLASDRIVRRGLDYARAGRVTHLVATARRLQARVAGSGPESYRVELKHDGKDLRSTCNCAFDWEPFCKHAVAVLAAHKGFAAESVAATTVDDFDPAADDAASPAPESLADLESQELEIRRHRGRQGGFTIRHLAGDRYFGSFGVASPSGREYIVNIRSLSDLVNGCTCLDQATSMIGTCKHIEAALAQLQKRAPRKFESLASSGPGIAQVVADRRDAPRIRLLLPAQTSPAVTKLAAEFFDRSGHFRGDPVEDFARFRDRARRLRKLVVHDDAVDLSRTLAADRQRRRRRAEVHRAVLQNGVHVPGFANALYPFQLEGTAFLAAAGRALLGDEMGLGKTVQAIAAERILHDRGEVRRTLVVCPASLKSQWADEIRRFTGLEAQVVQGPPRERLSQYRERRAYTIANYELLMRDKFAIPTLEPDLLILDEAQRIRNWHTLTAEAIKRLETRFAFVLTGTALQNRLDDLYSILQIVDRRVLGPLWAFNRRFVVREEGRSRIAGYRNLDELRRRLAPVVLRRAKDEVKLQLPERIDAWFHVAMTPAQRDYMNEGVQTAARYAALAEKRPLRPEEMERLFRAMQMARLACNAAGLVDKETHGSPKLDEFARLLEDLCVDSERKVVVFSEWEGFGRMAAEQAQKLDLGFVRFHGGVPTPRRGAVIERFRDDPACRVFFATDAGGVGLNLQFASAVINLELPWNPAIIEQRIGRVHRHGQTEPVQVFFLVAEDSFESGLKGTLGSKRALFDAALDHKSTTATVDAPASCLWAFRAATGMDDSGVDSCEARPETDFAEDSPPASARVLLEPGTGGAPHGGLRRDEHLFVARRKLAAARALQAAGAGAEAMAQAHACMLAVARSLATTDREAALATPRLLYEILVPRGDLRLEQVALISRAGELAAAYTDTALPAPEAQVATVIADAEGMLTARA